MKFFLEDHNWIFSYPIDAIISYIFEVSYEIGGSKSAPVPESIL